ncbi:MAG: hypothetical protein ABIU09_07430 [Pyrinomonadaceae bacterium]
MAGAGGSGEFSHRSAPARHRRARRIVQVQHRGGGRVAPPIAGGTLQPRDRQRDQRERPH